MGDETFWHITRNLELISAPSSLNIFFCLWDELVVFEKSAIDRCAKARFVVSLRKQEEQKEIAEVAETC